MIHIQVRRYNPRALDASNPTSANAMKRIKKRGYGNSRTKKFSARTMSLSPVMFTVVLFD